jgi:plasmid stabilization system protein ParE
VALSLRITERAAAETGRADAWWRDNRPGAPFAVREDLKGAYELLLRQPGVGVKVGNARLAGVRRLHLGRIRYFLYYRVTGEELIVLTLWHASRGSGPRI